MILVPIHIAGILSFQREGIQDLHISIRSVEGEVYTNSREGGNYTYIHTYICMYNLQVGHYVVKHNLSIMFDFGPQICYLLDMWPWKVYLSILSDFHLITAYKQITMITTMVYICIKSIKLYEYSKICRHLSNGMDTNHLSLSLIADFTVFFMLVS